MPGCSSRPRAWAAPSCRWPAKARPSSPRGRGHAGTGPAHDLPDPGRSRSTGKSKARDESWMIGCAPPTPTGRRSTARLRDHYAEGRLTQDELDERVSAALSAKTFGELRTLTTDLPGPWCAAHRRAPVLGRPAALAAPLPPPPAGAAHPAHRPARGADLGRRLGGVRVLPADPGVLAGDDADPHRHRPGTPAAAPLPVGRGRIRPRSTDEIPAPARSALLNDIHRDQCSRRSPASHGKSHEIPVAAMRRARRAVGPRAHRGARPRSASRTMRRARPACSGSGGWWSCASARPSPTPRPESGAATRRGPPRPAPARLTSTM